jgi:hypothetical protein
MNTLRINRSLDSNVDPKQLLRAHVEQLPVEKQREFVEAAFQLMGDRIDLSKVGRTTRELVS